MVSFATMRLVRRERSVVGCGCFRGGGRKRRSAATPSHDPPGVGVDRTLRGPDGTRSKAGRPGYAGACNAAARNMARDRRLSSDYGLRGIESVLRTPRVKHGNSNPSDESEATFVGYSTAASVRRGLRTRTGRARYDRG